MKEKIAKLIDVKTIVTFTVVGAITYGFVVGKVPIEVYAPIVASVIAYFFNKAPTPEVK